MYRIIGADGKEYGPFSTDQLRQWIVEGRANATTQVLAEGAAEWKKLGSLPEFAFSFGAGTARPGTPGVLTSLPVRHTNGFATAGLVLGIVSVTLGLCCYGLPFNILALVFSLIALSQIKNNPQQNGKGLAIAGLVLSILSMLISFIFILVFGMATAFDNVTHHVQRL
jgi:hypothetical protein